jgi:hypothetical protein
VQKRDVGGVDAFPTFITKSPTPKAVGGLTGIKRLALLASAQQWFYRPVPEVWFISLTVWGYFTNTPLWGVSEIGLALMAYVFAVSVSSGFHTVYSEFSHASDVESWGAVLLR